jgi:hypothetical protein
MPHRLQLDTEFPPSLNAIKYLVAPANRREPIGLSREAIYGDSNATG